MKIILFLKIGGFILIGTLLPYLLTYYKNHINDDDYFNKNLKILKRKIPCDFIFGLLAFFIINEFKVPEPFKYMGTIFIGSNGAVLIEKIIDKIPISNSEQVE